MGKLKFFSLVALLSAIGLTACIPDIPEKDEPDPQEERHRHGKGEFCKNDQECKSNLTCQFGVCKEFVLLNDDCDEFNLCSGTLQCIKGHCKSLPGPYSAICDERSDCLGGTCQMDIYGNGPFCLLALNSETTNPEECTSYTADENHHCKLPLNADCSRNQTACIGEYSCISGTCKRSSGAEGGICKDSSECLEGASCQYRGHQDQDGPYCLLNGGVKADDFAHCVSGSIYNDNGTSKCTYLSGGDCSERDEACHINSICEEGTCKRRLGTESWCIPGLDQCVQGGICQKTFEAKGPFCLLTDGAATDHPEFCASQATYDDNGTQKCKYQYGGSCGEHASQHNPEDSMCLSRICSNGHGAGEKGTNDLCYRDLHTYCLDRVECAEGICQKDIEGKGPFCLLNGGSLADDPSQCASGQTFSDGPNRIICKFQYGDTQYAVAGGCQRYPDICQCKNCCYKKICLRPLGVAGGICQDSSECLEGSCTTDATGDGPYCLLGDTKPLPIEGNDDCTYSSTDGGMQCISSIGENCSQDPDICTANSICVSGICKRLLGPAGGICQETAECIRGACQTTYEGEGPFCLLESGDEAVIASFCASQKLEDGRPSCL